MRRYADTFFRNWIVAVVPLIVFPVVALIVVTGTPRKSIISANVWADEVSLKHLGYSNPYNTPAQNMAASVNQLLQSPSFDLRVAHQSPRYWRPLAGVPGRRGVVVQDLAKNAKAMDAGPNLVTISYTTTNADAGAQVVQAILNEVPAVVDQLNQAQTKGVSYYTGQVKAAHTRLTASAAALGDYMKSNGIAPQNIASESLFDPKFASLYQAVQAAQTDVQSAEQQLAQMRAAARQTSFRIVDPPAFSSAPSRKKTAILDLGIALLAGLLIGGGFIVLRTTLDRSLRFADEVPDLVGLPVLAVLPYNRPAAARPTAKATLAVVGGKRMG